MNFNLVFKKNQVTKFSTQILVSKVRKNFYCKLIIVRTSIQIPKNFTVKLKVKDNDFSNKYVHIQKSIILL